MATREEWTRLINLSHDLALIEDDLREIVAEDYHAAAPQARDILWERFGERRYQTYVN